MKSAVYTLERESEPITLAEACAMFPRAAYKVSTLRAEADRGRLDIFRLGRRYHTTPAAMREWVKRCQDEGRPHASISTRDESSGLSETDRASSARAALSQTVVALKAGLPRTSGRNTNQRPALRR